MSSDEASMVNWFGAYWGAFICNDCPRTAVPIGLLCLGCEKPIGDGDRGVTMLGGNFDEKFIVPGSNPVRVAFHLDCHMRQVIGDKWKYLDAHA